MRDLGSHLDENTVMDVLDRAVAAEEFPAVAFHLATCGDCREVVDTCRVLHEEMHGVPSGD